MRRPWILIGLLLAAVGPLRRGAAQEPQAVRVTKQGVLVDFQDADLRLVVAALAEAGGLNVVYSELPARRVTLRMKQPVPKENLLALLRTLAQSNGLKATEERDFLRLEPGGAEPQDTASPPAEVRLFVYRVKHVRAAKLGATLQALFGGAADARAEGFRQAPLSEELREHAIPPVQPGAPAPRQGAPRVDVDVGPQRTEIPGQLKGGVQIVPDETTNSLLVRAEPDDWGVIRQAIEALDLRPLQVLIEVLIAEVRRLSEKTLAFLGDAVERRGDTPASGSLNGGAGDLVLKALRAGTLDVNLALTALAARGDVTILSRPVVLAQNNQEARILIGSERPFVQVSRSLPTDAGVRDEVIQYRDVGTKLTILPTINDDGYVNLQVLQEVSTATSEVQFGAPVISTREASTHLFIRDGQTAVLGGLIDRQKEKNKSGIPILMEIPLLGTLFSSTRNTTVNSELFLFLTPHIVTTDSDLNRVREGVERSTELLRPAIPKGVPTLPIAPRDTVQRNPLQGK